MILRGDYVLFLHSAYFVQAFSSHEADRGGRGSDGETSPNNLEQLHQKNAKHKHKHIHHEHELDIPPKRVHRTKHKKLSTHSKV
jgi:hypothetical protein